MAKTSSIERNKKRRAMAARYAEKRAELKTQARDESLSLEERYSTHQAYVDAVRRAADDLVRERLLLPADADEIVRSAEASDIGR